MKFLKRVNRRGVFYGIGLGILSLFVRVVCAYYPQLTESVYSRGIFPIIRNILDYTIGWSPIPFSYLLILGLLIYWSFRGYGFFQKPVAQRSWLQVVLSAISGVGYTLFLFLILWGFNYARVPMEQQLGFTAGQISVEELRSELEVSTAALVASRERLNIVGGNVKWSDLPDDLENKLRDLVTKKMATLGYPIAGKVRGRILKPKGILLRISTAGVYNPFTGESNIDQGLHPLQIPFTWSHEFTHGYGITSEAACNFLAYIACIESADPFINYAGHLGYWRYVAGNYKAAEREKYAVYRSKLPIYLTNDLQSIYNNSDKYPDILPDFRDFVYGSFLKAQGISDGLQNYSKVVRMNVAWRKKVSQKNRSR